LKISSGGRTSADGGKSASQSAQGHQVNPEIEEKLEKMFAEADHLSLDSKIEHTNRLYENTYGKAPLMVGLYFFVAVLNRNFQEIHSKSSNKPNSFNKLCGHETLHPDIKGATLRRWVIAAAIKEELQNDGIDTESLIYSALREIAKLPSKVARAKTAKEIIAGKLKGDAVNKLVQKELVAAKGSNGAQGTGKTDDALIGDLAREITSQFETAADNAEWRSLLVDPDQVREKFNFREQGAIYERAVNYKELLNKKKSKLEEKMEPVQKTLNFLDELIAAFQGTVSSK
jgi:hypothetical protein